MGRKNDRIGHFRATIKVVQETRDWPLEEENPSVRYLTLTSLLGHAEDSGEVRRTRDEIVKRGVVPALLDLQNDDGSGNTREILHR